MPIKIELHGTDYEALGLDPASATVEKIKTRYRILAVEHHPDKNPDDRDAAERRFRRITEAKDALVSYHTVEEAKAAEREALAEDRAGAPPRFGGAFSTPPPYSGTSPGPGPTPAGAPPGSSGGQGATAGAGSSSATPPSSPFGTGRSRSWTNVSWFLQAAPSSILAGPSWTTPLSITLDIPGYSYTGEVAISSVIDKGTFWSARLPPPGLLPLTIQVTPVRCGFLPPGTHAEELLLWVDSLIPRDRVELRIPIEVKVPSAPRAGPAAAGPVSLKPSTVLWMMTAHGTPPSPTVVHVAHPAGPPTGPGQRIETIQGPFYTINIDRPANSQAVRRIVVTPSGVAALGAEDYHARVEIEIDDQLLVALSIELEVLEPPPPPPPRPPAQPTATRPAATFRSRAAARLPPDPTPGQQFAIDLGLLVAAVAFLGSLFLFISILRLFVGGADATGNSIFLDILEIPLGLGMLAWLFTGVAAVGWALVNLFSSKRT